MFKHISILIIVLLISDRCSCTFRIPFSRLGSFYSFSFPNFSVTHLLLTYCSQWIDIDATESIHGNTALHICARTDTSQALATTKLLLDANAHVDCLNKSLHTPFHLAQTKEMKDLFKCDQSPRALKCLCARQIVDLPLPYASIWSQGTPMHSFLILHGELCNTN